MKDEVPASLRDDPVVERDSLGFRDQAADVLGHQASLLVELNQYNEDATTAQINERRHIQFARTGEGLSGYNLLGGSSARNPANSDTRYTGTMVLNPDTQTIECEMTIVFGDVANLNDHNVMDQKRARVARFIPEKEQSYNYSVSVTVSGTLHYEVDESGVLTELSSVSGSSWPFVSARRSRSAEPEIIWTP